MVPCSPNRGAGRITRAPFWCALLGYPCPMNERRLIEELGERINEALRDSPAADLEKNLRALLLAWFDRLDLVVREDFDVQRRLLERAQARLAELETRAGDKPPR